ncbi:MAG: hypothetical protein IJ217_05615 [Clostridia bacterium]|nr:hypothetical protein [Clostridia bacterium]
MSKYFNNAVVGNSNVLGCLTDKGELIRLYYPNIDYFQNIHTFQLGIAYDNQIAWLHNAEKKEQYYDTNIVCTNLILNDTHISQRDYVLPDKNVLVRKLKFSKKVNLFLYSKLNSDVNKLVSSMVVQDALIQYCQDFYMATFSTCKIDNYQVNNSKYSLDNAYLNHVDYIGMSDDTAILYTDVEEITLYISLHQTLKDTMNEIAYLRKQDEEALYESTKKYWLDYLKNLNVKIGSEKEQAIIERSAYLFVLLSDKKTGGMIASPDVDETFSKCGRYGYCWPRDAIFIMRALSLLKMDELVNNFYTVWAAKAQLDNGLFEQRYYVSGELAPSWGVQIDETAAIILGIYHYGKCRKMEDVIVKATKALLGFIDEDYKSKPCFDLWEERRGSHLYATASIYEALSKSRKMLLKIGKAKNKELINEIEKVLPKIFAAMRNHFVKDGIFVRSIDNTRIDISLLGLVTPFDVIDINNPIIKNTVLEIEKRLKLPNGGYLRYEGDTYIGGNAWIISSLWLAMYYLKLGNRDRAKELLDWVTNHADSMNFLPEQIEREGHHTAWISSLAWSHAMYVITLNELYNM